MESLTIFYPKGHELHFEQGHPERPERVEYMRQALESEGWWQSSLQVEPLAIPKTLIESVHTPSYLEFFKNSSKRSAHLDMDTYTTHATWDLAHQAAGGGIAVARAVWQREAACGLALTRPPGHHATVDRGMGFCLLNNIALAAQDLLTLPDEFGGRARRIAIVDLDLHHGNGTQDVFWRRDDVFYLSTHQYPYYPGSGKVDEIGAGVGKGFTANFPLPPLSGDRAFSAIMEELILPLLDDYQAEMLLVSFGFDPHWMDPLGQLLLSAKVYGELITRLVDWANRNCRGRIALFLEGGYDLDAAAACAQAVTAAMLGQTWEDPIGPAPRKETSGWMSMARQAHQIWQI
jgi:acetoin utilization deacetylase AcuC-like enzyme